MTSLRRQVESLVRESTLICSLQRVPAPKARGRLQESCSRVSVASPVTREHSLSRTSRNSSKNIVNRVICGDVKHKGNEAVGIANGANSVKKAARWSSTGFGGVVLMLGVRIAARRAERRSGGMGMGMQEGVGIGGEGDGGVKAGAGGDRGRGGGGRLLFIWLVCSGLCC